MRYKHNIDYIFLRGARSFTMHSDKNGNQFYLEYVYPSTIDKKGLKRNRYKEKVEYMRQHVRAGTKIKFTVEGFLLMDILQ